MVRQRQMEREERLMDALAPKRRRPANPVRRRKKEGSEGEGGEGGKVPAAALSGGGESVVGGGEGGVVGGVEAAGEGSLGGEGG